MNAVEKSAAKSFSELWSDPVARQALQSNPVVALTEAGIPTMTAWSEALGTKSAATKSGEKIDATTHWWGFDIVMNEKLTQDIIDGTVGVGTLGPLVAAALGAAGIVTGGVATLIGAACAAAFGLKVAEIKIVNNGKGVHWPITWLQWAAVLAAVPSGPGGLIAAIMLFIHPVRN